MESNNLPPFYVGEEVEYVTGKNMPKGTKVIVTGVARKGCGCWVISHDKDNTFNLQILDAKNHGASGWRCLFCKKSSGRFHPRGWQAASFRRIERPKPMTFIKLVEIQETEKEEVLTLN